MTERTIRLTVAYDGTDLVGWQRQASGASVQGLLEEALGRLEGRPVSVEGAGRTDAGVHVLAQVAGARVTRPMTPAELRRALNAWLTPDVRVIDVEDIDASFNARLDARVKNYRYRLICGDTLLPFDLRYAWHVRQMVDLDAMSAAARLLEGTHDFAAFQASGSDVATSVRTLERSAVVPESERPWSVGARLANQQTLVYEVTGNGFLRHMVRNIVGTLVEVGLGRLTASSLIDVLASRDRGKAGPTAPARGLFLVSVEYGPRGARVEQAVDEEA